MPDERPEDIAPLLKDDKLALYVAVWHRVPKGENGEPIHAKAGALVNVTESQARVLHERAATLGLVHPDGSIHAMARQYLRAKIVEAVQKLAPKGSSK